MQLKKRISTSYQHIVDVSKPGLVAIFILASCKSKKQLNSQNDEDLRIEIDGASFRELFPEKNIQLFNVPPAFNGSQLRGLKKTVVFLIVLDTGKHVVSLIPQNDAFIEDVEIRELSSAQNVEMEIQNQAEDGDRRPWVSFVLIDLPLKYLSASVSARWRFMDSDEVKLIIDGKIPFLYLEEIGYGLVQFLKNFSRKKPKFKILNLAYRKELTTLNFGQIECRY